jgi:hypothetical protein
MPFIFFVCSKKTKQKKEQPNKPSPGPSTARCVVFSKLVPILGAQTAEKTATALACRSGGSRFRAILFRF